METTDTKVKAKSRIAPDVREKIGKELGTMPDQALADKYSTPDCLIERHTIFYLRKQAGIPAFHQRPYTAPSFRGKLEDEHPEVKDLLGKVPLGAIADRFSVSRSCVRAAAGRLGKPTRATNFDDVFESVAG